MPRHPGSPSPALPRELTLNQTDRWPVSASVIRATGTCNVSLSASRALPKRSFTASSLHRGGGRPPRAPRKRIQKLICSGHGSELLARVGGPLPAITPHLRLCDPPGEAKSGVFGLLCLAAPSESPLSRLEAEFVCGALLLVS